MAKSAPSSTPLASTPTSSDPTRLPDQETRELEKLRRSRDADKIVGWVNEQHTRAKQARQSKQLQWYTNLAFFFGKQYVEQVRSTMPDGFRDRLTVPKVPYYKRRKTINRVRAFVRAEHSKFMSSVPNAIVVPSTAEEQDIRAAYAGEQAWRSISEAQKLRQQYSKAAWWTIITGNGFVKTHWDQTCIDHASGERGGIRFENVSPFNLFIPDPREQDIEDQPWVQYATIRSLEWCYTYYAKELQGRTLKPSVSSTNSLVEEGHLNLSTGSTAPDSCVVYETWVKPGADQRWPNGAVIISIENILVQFYEGLPYAHMQTPFTKFEHIQNSTFYADSPLVDLIELQKEYNELRTDISEAGRRMGRPQLLVQRGSLSSQRLTNEAGLIIEYKQGTPAPVPLALPPLPQYLVDQQDRVLTDFEDISGQHEVSKGNAPPGVTAGTAIAYLQEKDDQYLTSQYQGIEDGYGKIASQTLGLFVQYVDLPRKLKIVGADSAFDTLMLQGSDLKNSTDVRIEGGSSIGVSKAANDARVMDMFAMGIIDQPTALRLIEIGGSQKILDIINVAEQKAIRENMRMKMLTPEMIEEHQMTWLEEQSQLMPNGLNPELLAMVQGTVPDLLEPGMDGGMPPPPPMIGVEDFDIHEIHIEVHNKFRMGQEYEILPEEVKREFELHVELHEQMRMQKAMMVAFEEMEMAAQSGVSESGAGAPGAGGPEAGGPEAMLAGNGAAPDMAPEPSAGGEI